MCDLAFFEDSDPKKPRTAPNLFFKDIPTTKNLADHKSFNIDMTLNQLSLTLIHEVSVNIIDIVITSQD
jgi:hypothetical protein